MPRQSASFVFILFSIFSIYFHLSVSLIVSSSDREHERAHHLRADYILFNQSQATLLYHNELLKTFVSLKNHFNLNGVVFMYVQLRLRAFIHSNWEEKKRVTEDPEVSIMERWKAALEIEIDRMRKIEWGNIPHSMNDL